MTDMRTTEHDLSLPEAARYARHAGLDSDLDLEAASDGLYFRATVEGFSRRPKLSDYILAYGPDFAEKLFG